MTRPRPALSLVVPACNEESRLPRTIDAVLGWLDAHRHPAELVLSDDGSTDRTREVMAAAAARDERVVVVSNPVNRGKGAALRDGVARSQGDAVVFFDADLSYALDTIELALAGLAAGADLVIGARDLAPSRGHAGYSPSRKAATWAFNQLVDRALGLGIGDTQCGFKAFRGDVARRLFEAVTIEGFAFDVELLWLARRWKLRIDRLPLEMQHDAGSSVRLARDSLRMLRDIVAIRARAHQGRYPNRPAELGGSQAA